MSSTFNQDLLHTGPKILQNIQLFCKLFCKETLYFFVFPHFLFRREIPAVIYEVQASVWLLSITLNGKKNCKQEYNIGGIAWHVLYGILL